MVFQLSVVNLINTLMIATGIGICGMCFIHITMSVNLSRTFRRYFQFIFIILPVYMSTHLARRLMEGFTGPGVRITLLLLPFTEILTAGVMTFTISMLLLSVTNPKHRKYIKITLIILLVLNSLLLVYGSFSGLYYYFDEANIYRRGSAYLLANALPSVMLCIDIFLLIRYGKKIGRRIKLAFWFYIITPIVAMVVQGLAYGVQYIIAATVAGSVFMYFSMLKYQMEQYEKQSKAMSRMQNGLILVLADLVESRDKCTGDHVRKTAEYTRIIMEQLRRDGCYTDQLTDEFIEDVVRSAPLHDIGKIQVTDAILNKSGKLTEEEFEEIKGHTTAGRDIITSAIDMVSEDDSGYLTEARNLAYYHHEKWNGEGYPQGLADEAIPLSARIMAVADVFDALISKRSYKEAFPFDMSMEIIKNGSGTHFDPKVVEAFVHAENEVRRIACSNDAPVK